jgi:hypothetical protein
MKKLILATVPAVLLALPAPAAAERVARCVIASRAAPAWAGPCHFSAQRGGGFAISAIRGDMNGMSDFALDITAPGRGRGEYMMSSGRHEDGGTLRRSRRDPACWVGRDYSVCVYSPSL